MLIGMSESSEDAKKKIVSATVDNYSSIENLESYMKGYFRYGDVLASSEKFEQFT